MNKMLVCMAIALGCMTSGFAAEAPKATTIDLKIDQEGSPWHHASGKPLVLVADPLGKHTGKVVEVPDGLNMWLLNMDTLTPKDSVTLSYDVYLKGGNIQVAFANCTAGDNQYKGYFIGYDNDHSLSLAARLGLTGPWEGLGSSATKVPDGWNRLKIAVFRDGTIDVYANGDLYIEKTDKRIPLSPNWINFQANGEGKKYVANAVLEVR